MRIVKWKKKVNFADSKASSRVARGCRGASYQEYTSQERKNRLKKKTTQVSIDVLQDVVEFVAIEVYPELVYVLLNRRKQQRCLYCWILLIVPHVSICAHKNLRSLL